uniref:Uncharacterized protein n=1 Tax=Pygocentrus nattereri TaxID=42514 RepID=A0A3B4BZ81_PYGNA
ANVPRQRELPPPITDVSWFSTFLLAHSQKQSLTENSRLNSPVDLIQYKNHKMSTNYSIKYNWVSILGHMLVCLAHKSVFLDADCSFTELLQPDGYTHFLSSQHKLPVSLTLTHMFPYSQFLPLRKSLIIETTADEQDNPGHFEVEADLDSDDPLRFRQTVQNLRIHTK